jgi:hypothetical protein
MGDGDRIIGRKRIFASVSGKYDGTAEKKR